MNRRLKRVAPSFLLALATVETKATRAPLALVIRFWLRIFENFLETWIASQAIPPPTPQLRKRNCMEGHSFRRRRNEQLFHESDGLFCLARQHIRQREIS